MKMWKIWQRDHDCVLTDMEVFREASYLAKTEPGKRAYALWCKGRSKAYTKRTTARKRLVQRRRRTG